MSSRNRRRLERRTLLVGCAAAGVVAAALIAALALLSPVPVLEHRPMPHGGKLAFHLDPVTATARSTVATLAHTTPADAALAAAAGDGVFTGYTQPGELQRSIFGGPYAGACRGLLDPAPVAGVMRRARSGPVSVAVTAWAYPAGGGAAALAHARAVLGACDAPADAEPHPWSATTPAGASGVAVASSNGGDGVGWMIWARGDVVLSVTGTVAGGTAPGSVVSTLADRVDAAARAALETTCTRTDSAAADWSRNPYSGSYRPYRYTQTMPVPAVGTDAPDYQPDPTAVPAGEPSPGAPTPPSNPSSSPNSNPGAGGSATPSPGPSSAPVAEPVDELAPLRLPAGWKSGDPVPAPEVAERGPAPVLLRPEAIPVPAGVVTTEPTAPGSVAPAASLARFAVAKADVAGPGCGWEFTGVAAPVVDAAALDARTRANVEKAFAALAGEQVDAKLAAAGHGAAQADYTAQLSGWHRYQDYLDHVRAARTSWDRAQKAYDDSRTRMTALYQHYRDAQQPVPPDPTPTNPTVPDPTLPNPTGPNPTLPNPTLPTGPAVPLPTQGPGLPVGGTP